jgi:hypothetical protein
VAPGVRRFQLQPGASVPVRVDPKKPSRVIIDWDRATAGAMGQVSALGLALPGLQIPGGAGAAVGDRSGRAHPAVRALHRYRAARRIACHGPPGRPARNGDDRLGGPGRGRAGRSGQLRPGDVGSTSAGQGRRGSTTRPPPSSQARPTRWSSAPRYRCGWRRLVPRRRRCCCGTRPETADCGQLVTSRIRPF